MKQFINLFNYLEVIIMNKTKSYENEDSIGMIFLHKGKTFEFRRKTTNKNHVTITVLGL